MHHVHRCVCESDCVCVIVCMCLPIRGICVPLLGREQAHSSHSVVHYTTHTCTPTAHVGGSRSLIAPAHPHTSSSGREGEGERGREGGRTRWRRT